MGLLIAGTGHYLPDFVATNEAYEQFLDTSDEWITTRTGMKERRISLGIPTWKMGELAARQALEAAQVTPKEIDMVACTTVTGDFYYPSTAGMIQGAIGAKNAFAFDLSASCSGSVYGMDVVHRYLMTGGAQTVLMVSAENLTQTADYTDRGSCILFGDGAGAAVLRYRKDSLFCASLHSDPDGAKHLYAKKQRQPLPFSGEPDVFEEPFTAVKDRVIVMNGREVYKFATRAMPQAVWTACKKAGIQVEDLDLVIPHQANLRIIETAAKALKIPQQKVYVNIERCGNTSSATIMICLDECIREGRITRGDKVCLVGFGSGLTYAAAILEV